MCARNSPPAATASCSSVAKHVLKAYADVCCVQTLMGVDVLCGPHRPLPRARALRSAAALRQPFGSRCCVSSLSFVRVRVMSGHSPLRVVCGVWHRVRCRMGARARMGCFRSANLEFELEFELGCGVWLWFGPCVSAIRISAVARRDCEWLEWV